MTNPRGAYVARVWDMGVAEEVYRLRGHGLTVEVVTPEGHVAQMSVSTDGNVSVRAWLHDDIYENGGDNLTTFTASGRLHQEDREECTVTAADGASVTPLCRARSRFGKCDRSKRHDGVHAKEIGDGVWFGWLGRQVLGYVTGQPTGQKAEETP